MKLVEPRSRVRLANILWTTDFSSISEAALQYAVSIARRYDSQIYIAHVIRPDSYQLVPPEVLGSALTHTRCYAEQQIGQLLVSGRLRGIPHQVLLAEGDLWTTLSMLILEHEIDLVVAGTHGRTGIRKLLLGSAAEEVFRRAPVPVLTVGPLTRREVPAEAELRHILYATDFTPTAEHAGAYALSLAQEHQAHLTVMHVVREEAPSSRPNVTRVREYFLQRLKEIVPAEAELWCAPEFHVGFGEPASCILQAAEETQADLIVLGVRRTANFPGHLPPATAYQVVCQARCPVITVRGNLESGGPEST